MLKLKEIVENLIDNFLEAGDLAIQLREKGLEKILRLLLIYLSFQRRPLKIKIT